MGDISDYDSSTNLEKRFIELCDSMNIGKKVIDDAWQTYTYINRNITLEVKKVVL